MRNRLATTLIAAAVLALVIPAASADVCVGACGTGGGGGGGGGTAFNRLSISNGRPGIAAQAVTEGDLCGVTIHRSKPHKGNTTVTYRTVDGTATHKPQNEGPSDYNASASSVTFNPEQPTDITIFIQTNRDSVSQEPNEDFFVKLGRTNNGTIVDASGKCIIKEFSD